MAELTSALICSAICTCIKDTTWWAGLITQKRPGAWAQAPGREAGRDVPQVSAGGLLAAAARDLVDHVARRLGDPGVDVRREQGADDHGDHEQDAHVLGCGLALLVGDAAADREPDAVSLDAELAVSVLKSGGEVRHVAEPPGVEMTD